MRWMTKIGGGGGRGWAGLLRNALSNNNYSLTRVGNIEVKRINMILTTDIIEFNNKMKGRDMKPWAVCIMLHLTLLIN